MKAIVWLFALFAGSALSQGTQVPASGEPARADLRLTCARESTKPCRFLIVREPQVIELQPAQAREFRASAEGRIGGCVLDSKGDQCEPRWAGQGKTTSIDSVVR